ncbi:MAG: DUF6236 family protein [Reyranella sp.]|nr:DUF6236 family protein [Reyranella sp.]
MGEAKRRKLSDPTYGTSPKQSVGSTQSRKLLLSPYAAENGGFGILGDLPLLQAIQPSVLYWDSVTVPIPMPGMLPQWEAAIDYLVRVGAVERYDVQQENSYRGSSTLALFAQDFCTRLTSASNAGTQLSIMCPLGGQAALIAFFSSIAGVSGEGEVERRQFIEMSIREALPVPPVGVALQEIVEFKARRSAELKELNRAIDHLAVKLSGVEKLEDAVRVGREEIETALSDLDRVFSEKWTSRMLSSLRMNMGSIATGAAVAGGSAVLDLGLTAVATAALGGMAKPTIQAALGSFVGRKSPERATPYVYAYQVGRELKLPSA